MSVSSNRGGRMLSRKFAIWRWMPARVFSQFLSACASLAPEFRVFTSCANWELEEGGWWGCAGWVVAWFRGGRSELHMGGRWEGGMIGGGGPVEFVRWNGGGGNGN